MLTLLFSITFEPVPSDYAILKIHTLPPTGGDTLWASGYVTLKSKSTNSNFCGFPTESTTGRQVRAIRPAVRAVPKDPLGLDRLPRSQVFHHCGDTPWEQTEGWSVLFKGLHFILSKLTCWKTIPLCRYPWKPS
jgi:hypothetical protein